MKNKFGFIMKSHVIGKTGIGQPFYNEKYAGNVGKACDPSYAIQWSKEISIREEFIDKPTGAKIMIPMVYGGTNCNIEYKNFIVNLYNNKMLSDEVKTGIIEVIRHYDCYDDNGIVGFRKKQVSEDLCIELLLMKFFLVGFHRFDPLTIPINSQEKKFFGFNHYVGAEDKKKLLDKFGNYNFIHKGKEYGLQVKDKLSFEYNGVKYETPLRGEYGKNFIINMFSDLPKLDTGSVLQKSQARFLMDFGRENYLVACRGWGKGVTSCLIAALQEFAQDSMGKYKAGDNKIAFYSPDSDHFITTNDKFNNNIKSGEFSILKDAIKKQASSRVTANTIINDIVDGNSKEVGRFAATTWKGQNLLTGGRYIMGFFDEEADASPVQIQAVYKNLATWKSEGAIIFHTSTLDDDVPDSDFTKGALNAIMNSASQRPSEEDVIDIWFGYGLDKLTFNDFYGDNRDATMKKLKEARSEYLSRRRIFGASYDIYACEHKSPAQIKESLTPKDGITWEKIQAEHLNRIVTKGKLLDPKGAVVGIEELPTRFEHVVFAYDIGGKDDGAGFCVLGGNGKSIYVLDSGGLPRDTIGQYEEMKMRVSQLYEKYGRAVQVVIDATGQNRYNLETGLSSIGINDYILTRSHHGGESATAFEDGMLRYGKKVATREGKTSMDIGVLKICSTNTDLIEQMNNFTEEKTASGYVTHKGKGRKKDDLVTSMLMGHFYMFNAEKGLGYRTGAMANFNSENAMKMPDFQEVYQKHKYDPIVLEEELDRFGYLDFYKNINKKEPEGMIGYERYSNLLGDW